MPVPTNVSPTMPHQVDHWYFTKYDHILRINVSEEFEETKGVIRIRKSKDRQHNDKKKKYKRTNSCLQNIHIKLKIK